MEKIIAGLVQMDSGPDMNENMRMAEQYVREAAEQGAKLILFPETAEYTGADMPGHASAVPGYVSRRFSSLAKRYGVYLHCGSMTVRRHPGRPSNTSFLFGPDGETIAEYSKIHMFDVNIPGSVSYEESHEICPGNEIVLADTALGLFGMSICYDIRFPEQYRLMASSGADAFLIAADFTKATGERHWEALLRTRAILEQIPGIRVMSSAADNLEVITPAADKGTALGMLCRDIGTDLDYAFPGTQCRSMASAAPSSSQEAVTSSASARISGHAFAMATPVPAILIMLLSFSPSPMTIVAAIGRPRYAARDAMASPLLACASLISMLQGMDVLTLRQGKRSARSVSSLPRSASSGVNSCSFWTLRFCSRRYALSSSTGVRRLRTMRSE